MPLPYIGIDARLLSALVERGLLKPEMSEQIKLECAQRNKTEIQVILERKLIAEAALFKTKAAVYNVPFIDDISAIQPSAELLTEINIDALKEQQSFPFEISETRVKVMMSDPFNINAIQFWKIKYIPRQIEVYTATPSAVAEYIGTRFGSMIGGDVQAAVSSYQQDSGTKETVISTDDVGDVSQNLQGAPVAKIVNSILVYAAQAGASDIHIEPQNAYADIRFRIDGALHSIARVPRDKYNYLISEIIINSALQLDANRPQNGHLKAIPNLNGIKEIDIRVETIPVLHGQEVVMRLFQGDATMLKLSDLGITHEVYPIIKEILVRPHGMMIVVGPTGSGKTSTLYALLNELNNPERKIVTLEDPVEYELPGLSQSQLNTGESFLDRFRAVLREDPDVIMIGEIRDLDTAKTALQSALTGHLLLTTYHANNAATAIARLTDLVGDMSLISSAINLIVAQRLVRKICPFCRTDYNLNTDEAEAVSQILATLPAGYQDRAKNLHFYKGKGCDRCYGIGYKSRIGIFEMLKITMEMQQLIMSKALPSVIQASAVKNGMLTMEQDGILKALQGFTTVEEILKTVKE